MPTIASTFTFTNDHQQVVVHAALWYSARDFERLSVRCWELDTGKVYIPQPYQFDIIQDFFTTVINQRRLNMTTAKPAKPAPRKISAEVLRLRTTIDNQKIFLDTQTKSLAEKDAKIKELTSDVRAVQDVLRTLRAQANLNSKPAEGTAPPPSVFARVKSWFK